MRRKTVPSSASPQSPNRSAPDYRRRRRSSHGFPKSCREPRAEFRCRRRRCRARAVGAAQGPCGCPLGAALRSKTPAAGEDAVPPESVRLPPPPRPGDGRNQESVVVSCLRLPGGSPRDPSGGHAPTLATPAIFRVAADFLPAWPPFSHPAPGGAAVGGSATRRARRSPGRAGG